MRSTLPYAALLVAAVGCNDQVVDLGTGVPVDPEYATNVTIQGEADAGEGLPIEMAKHQFSADALAIDATRIYWVSTLNPLAGVNAKRILRSCEKNNCAATLISYPWSGFRQLAVDETRIYWVNWSGDYSPTARNKGVVACPISGCIGSPETVAPMADEHFLVDDPTIYWLTDDKLWKCTMGDCERTLTLLAWPGQRRPSSAAIWSLTASRRDLYWLEGDTNRGSIMMMPKDGTSPARALVTDRLKPRSLATRDNHLYWTEQISESEFEVRSCPLTDCTGSPTLVASSERLILTLEADGDRAAYWADMADPPNATGVPSVRFMASSLKGGGVPSVLYLELNGLAQWALDATHLYWTSYGQTVNSPSGPYADGAVRRMRRPF